ncbi:MAG: LamG domain-containing protein [Pseudomonadota bacterium]|nr:LamG domain-containing protein [Pseudomonadota bacterium]
MGMMKSTLRILVAAAICAVPSSVAYAQCTAAVTDGLIGYWRMDDTSGNTIVDSSGTGNTGTWYDDTDNAITTESVSGQVGTALDLENGDNSYILVDTDASISNTTRSVCLWINPESSLSNYKSLVDKADASDNGWNLYYNGSGQRVGWYTNYGGYIELANGTMPVGVWQHYCGTWDGSDGVSGMALYKDGQLATPNSSGDVGGYTSDAGNQLYIGGSIADSGNGFDGIMDQVMLFNRELSAAEVQAIYEGQVAAVTGDEGAIVFNQDHALMQYCDGTDWRMMGVGSYIPNGVQFDGSTISLTHASPLTDVVDGKTFTGSFWYQNDEFGSEIVIQSDGAAFMIKAQDWGSGPRLTFRTENEAGTVLMQYEVDAPEDADWHHVLFSFDQANPANNRLYLDGVNETFYEYGPGTPIDDIVDFTRPSIYFGFNSSAEHFDGKIADFWLEKNLFMDLDIEANRRKFISEAGLPMYLGEDGSIPTGVSPDIFLSGDTADWHTNKGTGGGFTESGVLASSSSRPEGLCAPETGPLVEVDVDTTYTTMTEGGWHDGTYFFVAMNNDGLGAYRFDGTNMTFVAKTPSQKTLDVWGDGTYIYMARGNSTDLKAFTFDGTTFTEVGVYNTAGNTKAVGGDGTYIYMVEDGTLHALTFDGSTFTSVATQSINDYASVNEIHVSNGYIFVPNGNVDGLLAFTFNGTAFTPAGSVNPDGYAVGVWVEWPYVFVGNGNGWLDAYTYDGSTFTPAGSANGTFGNVWGDGTYIYAGAGSDELHVYTHDGSSFSLEDSFTLTGANNVNGIYGDGTYVYVGGNQYGAAVFSGFATCGCGLTNKGRRAVDGLMQYNANFNVMEYCNGTEWVAMGPVGGAPVTDGLMGHWTLDETSGTFADSSGNGNTGTQSGGVSYEEEGVLANAVGFDGVDDHVQVTHSASLTTADDLSLSFWIKLHEDPDDLPNAVWRIMDKHPGFADGDPGWWLLINGYLDEALYFRVGDGSSDFSVDATKTEWDVGKWYMITVVYTQNGTTPIVDFYIDGEFLNTRTGSTFTPDWGTDNLRFGGGHNDSSLSADLDDVRMYNRALSDTEVRQLYYYGLSGGIGDVDNGCTSPARPEGVMLYNCDNNVMQFCNGEEWIRIGQ